MVADSQIRIVANYVWDDILALLGSVELWVESGAGSLDAEQRQAVRDALDTLESRLKKVGSSAFKEPEDDSL